MKVPTIIHTYIIIEWISMSTLLMLSADEDEKHYMAAIQCTLYILGTYIMHNYLRIILNNEASFFQIKNKTDLSFFTNMT